MITLPSARNKTQTTERFSRKLFVFLPRLTGSNAADATYSLATARAHDEPKTATAATPAHPGRRSTVLPQENKIPKLS